MRTSALQKLRKFQSTLPARGATSKRERNRSRMCNFNPRSPHGERLSSVLALPLTRHFNPRSPHGERPVLMAAARGTDISIHASRTGSDHPLERKKIQKAKFQSTLPARGATGDWYDAWDSGADFNPRSPHGERPGARQYPPFVYDFNPRSPHGERHCQVVRHFFLKVFQSTLPARGATEKAAKRKWYNGISIHAPRTGSDGFKSSAGHARRFQSTLPARGATRVHHARASCQRHFNPRSPHGERRPVTQLCVSAGTFQSTLPARGATPGLLRPRLLRQISIHAPRTGSDHMAGLAERAGQGISIHAPRTGSDGRAPM